MCSLECDPSSRSLSLKVSAQGTYEPLGRERSIPCCPGDMAVPGFSPLFFVPGDVPEVHLGAVCLQDFACLCLLPEGIICHASVCKCMCTCRVQVHMQCAGACAHAAPLVWSVLWACASACAIVVCMCSVQVHACAQMCAHVGACKMYTHSPCREVLPWTVRCRS